MRNQPSLRTLADRVNAGDRDALPAFTHELERQMARIVRRALRAEDSNSPLTRRIRAEAGARTERKSDPGAVDEGRLASGLCAAVVNRLRAGCPSHRDAGDTLRT